MRSFVLRLYALIFLFFSLCVFSSAFALESAANQQVPQNLANKPKDRPIAFKSKPDSLVQCLTPIFTHSEGYVGVSDCGKAIDARYDVFSRIAWKLPDTWVCLSAENEEYIQGKRLILRPCVIDDKTQSFTIKNNMLYTPDLRFVVQISNGFLTLGKSQSQYTESHFTFYDMQEWLDTIATPPTLSQKSFIAWSFITQEGFDLYYLRNDFSIKDTPEDLYFNPENGYIAQYNPANAQMLCLTSTQTKNQDWNWVSWQTCDFHAPKNPTNPKTWNLFMLADNNQAMLKDYLGNFLRVTKYGIHWGVPYSAKPDFLGKDTGEDQTSYFRFSNDLTNYQRFLYGNLSDSLPSCPANGITQETTAQNASFANLFKSLKLAPAKEQIQVATLPPSFTLNEAWKRRLWQIATTTDGVLERAGDCGVCLLQSYQMIAEMNEYTTAPLESGGFFFNTEFGRNPFPSFRARYPMLATSLEQYRASNIPPGLSRSATFEYAAQMYRAIALSLFPGHFWLPSEFATSDITIRSALRDLFEQPAGTLWVMQMYYVARDSSLSGHGMPVLRTNNGIQFIPTNLPNVSYESYEQALSHSFAHNLMEAYNVLTRNGTLNLYMLYSLRLREIYPNPINAFLSNNNCSGEGEERRGSRNMPLSGLINQCVSGRCVLQ